MANILKTTPGRFGTLAGGLVLGAAVWVGLGGSMGAAPPVPDAQTCLPTCTIDGRSFVVAGNDPTTLSAQAITIGLSYTVAEATANFEIFDADETTNWDTPLQCGGCPGQNTPGPVLVLSLYRDPAADGTGVVPANLVATWTPGGVPGPIEQGAFAATNNTWSGDSVPQDAGAVGLDSNYHYALVISPFDPATNQGWNAFKIRANGTVSLLGNQIVGFIAAMNVGTSDFNTIYPAGFPDQTGTPYNGMWVFPTTLPSFLGDVTVFDGDMDFGNSDCDYNDTDDPDSDPANPNSAFFPSGIPPFATGSAAAAEGVAVATGNLPCTNPPPAGVRTGSPAEDGAAGGAFTRVPAIVPAGIAYQLRAPDGQVFLNQNPSGNKEWEQFKIQKVNNAADIPGGIACPPTGFAESPGFTLPDNPNDNLYPASDCRTLSLPGGNWQVELDGMDLANLNFWFFSFKVDPPLTEYSIGRRVWFDTDGDGVEDPGEPGANGVDYTVTVFDSPTGIPDGTVVRTGTTVADGGDDGLIEETGLPAGNYTVTVDGSNFLAGGVLEGFISTTGGEVVSGVEVGLPVCTDTNVPSGCGQPVHDDAIFGYDLPVVNPTFFIVIDEDSIDNGIGPNDFSAHDVNDQKAKIGLRQVLPRFDGIYIGTELWLYTGQTHDEGWFSVPTIPPSWADAGPTTDGLKNFVGVGNAVGPGLGKGKNPEKLLDKIPDVTPWNSAMLYASVGATFCAVVYDSDISINYNPLNGSLKGANLGIVAFQVLEVVERTGSDSSSSSLPKVRILILNANEVCAGALNNQLPPSS